MGLDRPRRGCPGDWAEVGVAGRRGGAARSVLRRDARAVMWEAGAGGETRGGEVDLKKVYRLMRISLARRRNLLATM